MTDAFSIVFIVLFAFVAFRLRPAVLRFLRHHGIVASNYEGRTIPTAAGLYLWLLIILYIGCMSVIDRFPFAIDAGIWLVFAASLTIVFFVGWLDDTVGENEVKGIKGHIQHFRQTKTITTGLLKAGAVVIVSLWSVIYLHLAYRYEQAIWMGVQALLIVLFTNTFNLLDLRPGRALKSSLLGIVPLILFAGDRSYLSFLLPLFIGILALLPIDLKARAMIGDTGANLIGFTLGFCYIVSTPHALQFFVLLLLIGLHIIAEKTSISRIISRNRLLNWLDEAGRK